MHRDASRRYGARSRQLAAWFGLHAICADLLGPWPLPTTAGLLPVPLQTGGMGGLAKCGCCAGDGPRQCVAQRFAWEEALIGLAQLFRAYQFALPPGQGPLPVKAVLTLTPADGVRVVLRKRA